MSTMREAWTDERLDDLRAGMHREFDQVHADNRDLRTEVRAVRTELKADVAGVRGEVAAVNRNLIWGFGSLLVTILGAIVAHAL